MKYSKYSAVLLAAAILVQLAIPAVFIAEKSAILQQGTEFRVRVQWLDFDDDEIGLHYDTRIGLAPDEMRYAVPEDEIDGVYQSLRLTKERPTEGLFMQSASVREFTSPIGEYAMPGANVSGFYEKWNAMLDQGHYCVANVTVYNGKALLTGVFLDDGTPIGQIFQ